MWPKGNVTQILGRTWLGPAVLVAGPSLWLGPAEKKCPDNRYDFVRRRNSGRADQMTWAGEEKVVEPTEWLGPAGS